MEASIDPDRVVIIANVLGMWFTFAVLCVFYETIWRRHRYDCVRFKLNALRDEVFQMACLEKKIRPGAFLHRYLTYEIDLVAENAEKFSFLDFLFDQASEEARGAHRLLMRFRSELDAIPDRETALRIERIRLETLSCAKKFWRMNSVFFRMKKGSFSAAQVFTAILVKGQA